VYTPTVQSSVFATNSSSLKPVMVWFHGGGSTTGSGADSTFDGASLISRSDIVLVVPNYRLNIFGCLSLNDDTVTGNYAVADKIEALKWVQTHIAAFGGNPTNVTIFGQSSGGASCVDLLISPKANGLFSGAILESAGNGHIVYPETWAEQILPYVNQNCSNINGTARLECLQALPAETLLNWTSHVGQWKSVVDNIYIDDLSIAQIAKGRSYINSVNVIEGFMHDEAQSLLTTNIAPNMTQTFNESAQILVKAGGGGVSQAQADVAIASGLWIVSNETYNNGSTSFPSVYNASVNLGTDAFISCPGSQMVRTAATVGAYQSLWVYEMLRGYGLSYYDFYDLCTFPVGKSETPYYKCHSSDLYEVFGTYYLFDQPIRADEDIYYTNAIQDMWASFARSGNPNVPPAYLQVRGYSTTQLFMQNFTWPQFDFLHNELALLQYPGPTLGPLPDLEHCAALSSVIITY
jgi:carboxylesterase type B